MLTSALAQTSFTAISQAPMNSLFPASAALAKTAVLFSALMLSQASIANGQEVQPGKNGEFLAQAPLNAELGYAGVTVESGDKGVTEQNEVLPGLNLLTHTPLISKSDDKGEHWMGHYFDYATYPHGHFDCSHGSTAFDPYRSKNVEERRMIDFWENGHCSRGLKEIKKEVTELVVCNPNGEITRTAISTRDL